MDQQYLKLLARDYPNIKKASAEIINLRAILSLPKGTEYFLSDLHGEHEAFIHMVNSASGTIRAKIDEHFGDSLSKAERDILASLVYSPQAELARRRKAEKNYDAWCREAIINLVVICRSVSTKYTRSRVRKRLPEYFDYAIDELLHADDEANKARYYTEIINSLFECGVVEEFIIEFAECISRLAVDKLHIIGDIWDRGAHPDKIMDYLMDFHDVDFQWGNHDVVWMGASIGHRACIANAVRMNTSYNNFDMLEVGYGINLRPLSSFAYKYYGDDPCEFFKPHVLDRNRFDQVSEDMAAKMHKAISIIQFKLEGQRIMAHPEYHLEHRLLLDKINRERGSVTIKGAEWPLRDTNFPTIDPEHPYELTEDENKVIEALRGSFMESERLQRHVRYIFDHGALYMKVNGNLLYHGCIPVTEEGEFEECYIKGQTKKGKALMDFLDQEVRREYFEPETLASNEEPGDLMWYLWLGAKSPLFGKDQMTTFERFFIEDKSTHKEHTVPYYRLVKEKAFCEKLLSEFGLDPAYSHILNGHVPVKFKDGESPIKGGGKLFVIDGGMSKAYQKTTGIAGYTFIFNSRFMALAEHKPYKPMGEDGIQEFTDPTIVTVELLKQRLLIQDMDQAGEIREKIDDLKALIEAYRKGEIKEIYE